MYKNPSNRAFIPENMKNLKLVKQKWKKKG